MYYSGLVPWGFEYQFPGSLLFTFHLLLMDVCLYTRYLAQERHLHRRTLHGDPRGMGVSIERGTPVRLYRTVQFSIQEQLLRSNEKQFRGGLVFKARRLLYRSTLGRE